MTLRTRKTPPDYTPYTDDAPLRTRSSPARRLWQWLTRHGDEIITLAAIVGGTVAALGILGANVSSPRETIRLQGARIDTLTTVLDNVRVEQAGLRAGVDFLVRRECLGMTPHERASQPVCDGLPVPVPASYLPRPNARATLRGAP